MGLLSGKTALIFGVANDHSIAWGIAQAFAREGARLAFSYDGEALAKRVRPLAASVNSTFVEPCDVSKDEDITALFQKVGSDLGEIDILVHAVAFANRDELSGPYYNTSRAGFHLAMDISMITEETFGFPIYRWASTRYVTARIVDWWQRCKQEGVTALLFCYALGKAQRILAELTHFTQEEVLLHGAVASLTHIYREQGVSMVPTKLVSDAEGPIEGRLILAPPSAHRSPWMKRFRSVSTAFASGWMAVRGIRRRRGYHRGFVLSDHADWQGLLSTIEESRASRLLVTHGSSDILARYLREVKGMKADALTTHFGEGEG